MARMTGSTPESTGTPPRQGEPRQLQDAPQRAPQAPRAGSVATANSRPPQFNQGVSAYLTTSGWQFPAGLQDTVASIIRSVTASGVTDIGVAASMVQARLMATPAFRAAYPGIFNNNGTLRMTPGQWESYWNSARSVASARGFRLTRQQVGVLLDRDVSLDELSFRVEGAAQITANRQLLGAFNQQLRAQGQAPIRNAKQAFDFFSGKSDQRVYEAYESASIGAAAASAGIDINAGRAAQIANRTAGFTSLETAEESYGRIAQSLREANVELGSEGLSRRHLEVIEFGGPNRAQLAAKAERILRTRKAQRAVDPLAPQTSVTSGGRLTQGFNRPPVGM